jgi:hypothetical protein
MAYPIVSMSKPITSFITLLFIGVFLLSPRPTHAQTTLGVISGVVQPPIGEEMPSGLQVELLFLPNGQGPPVITPQPLPADGTFRFENVDTAPQHRYLVRVTVEGEDNLSELLAFGLDQSELDVTIALFAKTTDSSALSLAGVNYILDVQPGGWVVATLYRFENGGTQIIENLTNPPVLVPVPTDALNVQFSQGIDLNNVSERPSGFTYAGPFPPGETTILFSYNLPYQEGSQSLILPISDVATPVRLLVPQLGQESTVEGLTFVGEEAGFEDRVFDEYNSEGPYAAPTITFAFTNLPPLPEGDPNTTPTQPTVEPLTPLEQLPRWAGIVPILVGLGGALLYLAIRPAPDATEQRATLRTRRDQLIAEVAMLDIRHETGSIGEQTHQRQRATMKRELKEIIKKLAE